MKFDWKNFLMSLLALAPAIVGGVEKIHQGANGKSKQTLATQSLLLATGVAEAVDPDDTATIEAATLVTQAVIDHTVKAKNDAGAFVHAGAAAPVSSSPASSSPVSSSVDVPQPGPGLHSVVPA